MKIRLNCFVHSQASIGNKKAINWQFIFRKTYMKIKKPTFFLFAQLVITTPSMAVTPQIINVSGVIATGNAITITGTNMINDNTTGWYVSAQKAGYEGTSPAADGWSVLDAPKPGIAASYVTDIKLIGSKSLWLYNNVNCQNQTSCGANRILEYPPSKPATKYFSSYIRYSGSWPTNYMKMFLTDGPDQWYFQTDNGSSWRAKHGGLQTYFPIQGGIQQNRWYHWEIMLRDSSTDTMTVWMDGQLLGTWNHSKQNTTWQFFEYGIPNWDGTTGPMNVWFDRFVYSSSRIYPASKIEIGNNSDYQTATKRYQEPISLGDSSAQIKLDLSGLGGGPYYLWITNNRQERSNPFVIGSTSSEIVQTPQKLEIVK